MSENMYGVTYIMHLYITHVYQDYSGDIT